MIEESIYLVPGLYSGTSWVSATEYNPVARVIMALYVHNMPLNVP